MIINRIISQPEAPEFKLVLWHNTKTNLLLLYKNAGWESISDKSWSLKKDQPMLLNIGEFNSNPQMLVILMLKLITMGCSKVVANTMIDMCPVLTPQVCVSINLHEYLGQSGQAMKIRVKDTTLEADSSYLDLYGILFEKDNKWIFKTKIQGQNTGITDFSSTSIVEIYFVFDENPLNSKKDLVAGYACSQLGSILIPAGEVMYFNRTDFTTGTHVAALADTSEGSLSYPILFLNKVTTTIVTDELDIDYNAEIYETYLSGEKVNITYIPKYGMVTSSQNQDTALFMYDLYPAYKEVEDRAVNHFVFNVLNMLSSDQGEHISFSCNVPILWNNDIPPTFAPATKTTISILDGIGTYTTVTL